MWEESTIAKVLFSEEDIKKRAAELGAEITKDYQGKKPLLVALLKGSVPFMAELIKHIDLDLQYDFMDVSSYEGTESTGDVRIIKDLDTNIRGLDILLVEDIVDTGRTLATIRKVLLARGARSVEIVTLLNKPSRRVYDLRVEYAGFEVGTEFVVGFGMDFDQRYRCLPYVGVLKEECYKK